MTNTACNVEDVPPNPETVDFLGFTHCCSANRSGGFQILRLTIKKRMRATLLAIRGAAV